MGITNCEGCYKFRPKNIQNYFLIFFLMVCFLGFHRVKTTLTCKRNSKRANDFLSSLKINIQNKLADFKMDLLG